MGLDGIRWHSSALGIHRPEVVLRARVALLGGTAVPRDGFGGIRWHADAGQIKAAEDELRLGVARLGTGAEVCEGLCGWPVFILCLNTGRTAHREGEGGDPEGAAHKVATHYVYSKALADRYSTRRFAAGPIVLNVVPPAHFRSAHETGVSCFVDVSKDTDRRDSVRNFERVHVRSVSAPLQLKRASTGL